LTIKQIKEQKMSLFLFILWNLFSVHEFVQCSLLMNIAMECGVLRKSVTIASSVLIDGSNLASTTV